ncbi:MAG: YbaK/EbsC family protein, partial [Planctomycetota bacterium]
MTSTILELLESACVEYRYLEHPPTRTSSESAEARGEPLSIGGKSLVLKVGDTFRLCVLGADRRIRSNAIRRHFRSAKARFATREELLKLTGLVPGCVPP